MTAIAVLGSTHMDLVAYVARAPERGETVTGRELRTVPGGKGANQAVAAARAGADVTMIGAVGDDAYGTLLRSSLEHAGVHTGLLHTAEGPSGTAHIVVDDTGAKSVVVIPGANGTVTGLGPGEMAAIAGADLLLLQLELPLSAVLEGARVAHAQGVRTILTPSPVQSLPSELFDCVDVLIPNEHEAAALSGSADPARRRRSCSARSRRSSSHSAPRAACTRPGRRTRALPRARGHRRRHHRGRGHLRRHAGRGARRATARTRVTGLGVVRRRALRAAAGRLDLHAVPQRDRRRMNAPAQAP